MRRLLALIAAFGFLCGAPEAVAQTAQKVPRIGLLSGGADPAQPVLFLPFFARMEALGYVEGRTVAYERRFGAGRSDPLPGFAADLVRADVDVIVCTGERESLAARQATSTIPIVTMVVADPIALGLAKSLSRPGGNVTGMTTSSTEIFTKRLSLLREAVPGLATVAILLNPTNVLHTADQPWVGEVRRAAAGLGIDVTLFEARERDELDAVFAQMRTRGIGGVIIPQSAQFFAFRHEVAAAAMRHGLPTIGDHSLQAEAGTLLT